MFLRSVASESVSGNLKLTCSKAESEERKAPKQDTDSLSRELLQSTDIDSLRVITEPIPEVDALDIKLLELGVAASYHNQLEESVLDITMAIIDCVDLRDVSMKL